MSWWLGAICLFVPFAGIVIWATQRGFYPRKAKIALILGLISFGLMVMGLMNNPRPWPLSETGSSSTVDRAEHIEHVDPRQDAIDAVKASLASDYRHVSGYETSRVRGGYSVQLETWPYSGLTMAASTGSMGSQRPGRSRACRS